MKRVMLRTSSACLASKMLLARTISSVPRRGNQCSTVSLGRKKAWRFIRQGAHPASDCRFLSLFAVQTLRAPSSSSLLRPLISVLLELALPPSMFFKPSRLFTLPSPLLRQRLPALFPVRLRRSRLESCGRPWWATHACSVSSSSIHSTRISPRDLDSQLIG